MFFFMSVIGLVVPFCDILLAVSALEISVQFFRFHFFLQKLQHINYFEMNFSVIILFSFKFNQILSSFKTVDNEISISIKLMLFVLQKNKIEDTRNLCLEIIKGLLASSNVGKVREVNAIRLAWRIVVQDLQIGSYLAIENIIFILILVVILGNSELLLVDVIFMIVSFRARERIAVLWVRWRIFGNTLGVIVVGKLVVPSSESVKLEYGIASLDCEAWSIFEFRVNFKSSGVGCAWSSWHVRYKILIQQLGLW